VVPVFAVRESLALLGPDALGRRGRFQRYCRRRPRPHRGKLVAVTPSQASADVEDAAASLAVQLHPHGVVQDRATALPRRRFGSCFAQCCGVTWPSCKRLSASRAAVTGCLSLDRLKSGQFSPA
jgi:hypothetical protein